MSSYQRIAARIVARNRRRPLQSARVQPEVCPIGRFIVAWTDPGPDSRHSDWLHPANQSQQTLTAAAAVAGRKLAVI
jgi:hypothetical protein